MRDILPQTPVQVARGRHGLVQRDQDARPEGVLGQIAEKSNIPNTGRHPSKSNGRDHKYPPGSLVGKESDLVLQNHSLNMQFPVVCTSSGWAVYLRGL